VHKFGVTIAVLEATTPDQKPTEADCQHSRPSSPHNLTGIADRLTIRRSSFVDPRRRVDTQAQPVLRAVDQNRNTTGQLIRWLARETLAFSPLRIAEGEHGAK